MPTHCGDKTCSSCVVAGDFIFLTHYAGGTRQTRYYSSNEIGFRKNKKHPKPSWGNA